jgi:CRP-like cAMP-binding protein
MNYITTEEPLSRNNEILSDSRRKGAFPCCELDWLNRVAPARPYASKQRLLDQGDEAECAFLIEEGFIKLTRIEDDRQAILGLEGPGAVVGGSCVILHRPHTATAETVSPCRLRRLPGNELRLAARVNPSLAWRLLNLACDESRRLVENLGSIVCLSVRSRVERLLYQTIEKDLRAGARTPLRLSLPLRHWEIAQMLAVTPEHLSRVFRELVEDGIIERRKGWILVTAPERLQAA